MFHTPVVQEPPEGDVPFARLSPAARSAWAKHDPKTDGHLPLWRHLADSAGVAGKLWDAWLPANIKSLLSEGLPEGESGARRLVTFLAGVHDVGKATCAFACQVDSLADRMRAAGLEMPSAAQYGTDRRAAPHGLAGQLLLQEWLSVRCGMTTRVSGQFAVVAGGHHGTPPEHQQIHDLQLRPWLLRHPGDSENLWRSVQYELMDGCAELAGVTQHLPGWKNVRLTQPTQVLVTAIVILSDWIASSAELFPYDPASWHPIGPVGEARRLTAAWEGLDLPGPWEPEQPDRSAESLFAERFVLPVDAQIRPVQAEAVRTAHQMASPGLLMIEAPMGEGKTEAAFAAAEILAARSGAGGCLVALPTRATGDAMFPRLLGWLDHLPDSGSSTVALAHAKAALNEVWSGLLRRGHRTIAAIEPDRSQQLSGVRSLRSEPAGLQAHQWLRGRKKALLASFAVGTIDQVLFAGLKSRHLALRHLAVAGKVVIIDEVHAYDAYMGRYLDRVLEWLAAYRVPVIMLSATLPADRRRALAASYAGEAVTDSATRSDSAAYPLITAVAPGAPVLSVQPPAASGRRTDVTLERLDDDLDQLADRLMRELQDGGCALVVRNTVQRVLDTADVLRERFGAQHVTVTHSRFLAADRAARDAKLRDIFGPDGERPSGPHIVVASQVVEQSLDVDFDLLVTDLAPVDLMLQRMGRLHRHPRKRPPKLATARCLVAGAAWEPDLPQPVRGSEIVYGRHALLRSLAALGPHLDGEPLLLPHHISPLVQAAYGEAEIGPSRWAGELSAAQADHFRVLADKRQKAEAFLLGPVRRAGRPIYDWLGANAGDADDTREGRAQVRDSQESLEVMVVQRLRDGTLATVAWLPRGQGGLRLPTDFPPDRRTAEAVAASAIALPRLFSHPGAIDRTIGELEHFMVPAWQAKECPLLAGELMLVLDEDCQTRLSGFVLRYSVVDGLRVQTAFEASRAPTVSVHEAEPTKEVDDERAANRANPTLVTGKELSPLAPKRPPLQGSPSFSLVSSAWLPVQRLDGSMDLLSLMEVFAQARDVRRLAGDLPTQDFALLRLLLAILHDAVDGPAELDDWAQLWESPDPFGEVPGYLDRHRNRFDLFHSDAPFYQVAGLSTAKGETASLNRLVADVPNGEPFFTMRNPGVRRLSYAEAARWLVHAHAYDPSGIKSGMVGDPRAKSGKVYPLGVGSLGNLGGIYAEGVTLHQTLLLNLIAFDEGIVEPEDGDLPAWRHPPSVAGAVGADRLARGPVGLRDLYTWQSRRLRLHVDGEQVSGVVLGYGDPLTLHAPWKREPMCSWRRSAAQEKKQGRPLVYMPRQHDPSRAAWRGLGSLLPARRSASDDTGRGTPESLPAGIVSWYSMLASEGAIEQTSLIRVRLVGAVYGTQQSVVDEVVDDAVVLPVVLLHEEKPDFGATAVDAVHDAQAAVTALGQLAGNLARAVGSNPDPASDAARDLGFGALDGPYRQWLASLHPGIDPHSGRKLWQTTVRKHVTRLGRELLGSAGSAASEGRVADVPGSGRHWVNDARAEQWFRQRLNQVLPRPPQDPDEGN
ncbi:type I-E CRISPR-associated protein Cse1/CasA [Streptomyces sp. BG9H]|uniref:Type I-E CRISPR-associated protein Cse1/CasA n=1 Tax=Streptomyces anatolicus TaxID=2675858 RepID=A0ABS6YS79_9ACTN|nr:type I-E CRISPR-associated protein Cse1/CasA [Streptomyces anatolicus]